MNESPSPLLGTRRDFLKTSGKIAAASALAGVALPHVHAAGSETIQVALIGCGGRGTGAAGNALSVKGGPIKLVALADVFEDRVTSSYNNLREHFKDQVDVPKERQFIGFDAYKKAMDCLNKGDVAILATPPGFRWVQFAYAIEKTLNVFMEKPVTVDAPTTRRMIKLGEEADKKNLKVGVGLMVRHCKSRQALKQRIDDGAIGEILLMRAYRMAGPMVGFAGPNPGKLSDLMYQVQNFHSFLWASGGIFSDFYIHQIDECSWMKGSWPVKAQAIGGRHYRGDAIDQNFDNYDVEYTYKDGSKLFMGGRNMAGAYEEFASFAQGSKGLAIISTAAHTPGQCRTFSGWNISRKDMTWAFPQPEPNPYQLEWDDLIDAIRNNKPYNEVKRGAEASLVTSMGRMAAHTAQVITFDEMVDVKQEFAPEVGELTMSSKPPLAKLADGKYPVPQPGILKDREY